MVKLKKGDAVEVLKKYDTFSAWFPAKIISIDGNEIHVEFKNGEHEMEITHIRNIRPCPPDASREHRWRIGDMVEVFDNHSWKVGKVAKVLHDKHCVIKISGSIQLKTFHSSRMRICQTWRSNQWDVIVKDDEHRQAINTHGRESRSPQDFGKEIVARSESCSRDYENHHLLVNLPSLKTTKRNNRPSKLIQSSVYDPVTRKVKKMKPTLNLRSQTANHPEQANEDNSECSVASCSSNYIPNCTSQCIQKSLKDDAIFFDDAESVCPVEITLKNSKKNLKHEEDPADVHKLEVHAYQLTVQAFYASGPLSWEQESLLTNLRLSLHISNEEHLVHLRNLLSSSIS